jgi:hypothetical protein
MGNCTYCDKQAAVGTFILENFGEKNSNGFSYLESINEECDEEVKTNLIIVFIHVSDMCSKYISSFVINGFLIAAEFCNKLRRNIYRQRAEFFYNNGRYSPRPYIGCWTNSPRAITKKFNAAREWRISNYLGI